MEGKETSAYTDDPLGRGRWSDIEGQSLTRELVHHGQDAERRAIGKRVFDKVVTPLLFMIAAWGLSVGAEGGVLALLEHNTGYLSWRAAFVANSVKGGRSSLRIARSYQMCQQWPDSRIAVRFCRPRERLRDRRVKPARRSARGIRPCFRLPAGIG